MLPIWELAEKAATEHGIAAAPDARALAAPRPGRCSPRSTTQPGSDNWGFVPYTEEDLDAYAQELQLVFDRNWFMVAENADGRGGRRGADRRPTSTRCSSA